MPLSLAIFDESTTAAIECYSPEKSDATCFSSAFQKLFVICNAKTEDNTSNELENAVFCNNSKSEFLLSFATWIVKWSACKNFLLTFVKNINFWGEDIFVNNDLKETVLKIKKEISPIMTEIFEIELSEDSKQVVRYIAGYVAKKIKKHFKCRVCNNKIISNDNE